MATRFRTPLRKPRTDHEPTRKVLLVAGFFLILSLVGLFIASTLLNGVPLRSYGKLYVSASEAGNLLIHDAVRVGGVRVGQVMSTDIGDDGRPRLELQLEPGLKLPVDSGVRIRANGLLGARYVELAPGQASDDLPDGATLAAGENALTYGVPEALDTFDEETRGRLRDMLGGLGQGFFGRGQNLNETLNDVATQVPNAQALVSELLTAPAANAALLPAFDAGIGALDANRDGLGRLLQPSGLALQPLIDERAATQDTLEVAPGSLSAARTGLSEGQRLLAAVRVLSASAQRTLAEAPPGLRATSGLLDRARSPLARTRGLLVAVDETVDPALRLTSALRPVLPRLQSGVQSITPTIERMGEYGCDFNMFATNWRSMTGFVGPGEGSAGPASHFRLQVVPPLPTEALGIPDAAGQLKSSGYQAPCQYPPSEYESFNALRGRR